MRGPHNVTTETFQDPKLSLAQYLAREEGSTARPYKADSGFPKKTTPVPRPSAPHVDPSVAPSAAHMRGLEIIGAPALPIKQSEVRGDHIYKPAVHRNALNRI